MFGRPPCKRTFIPIPPVLRPILCIISLSVLTCSGPLLFAQNATGGSISGVVTDPSGAGVPNVAVTATNQNTHIASTATGTTKGYYTIENLPDGDYTITFSASGFSSLSIANLHLDPGQRRGQDASLKVGNVDTKVNVEADTLAVQTESAESGGTITSKEVQNLMVNGRNFSQLTGVLPGVSNSLGANQNYEAGQGAIDSTVIVNGSSDEETMYTIDGVLDVTPQSSITLPITPVIDFIQEIRVLGDNFSARYGLAGREILITTKSGGQQYHGSGFFYDRTNEYGSAKPYTYTPSQVLPSLHLTDWGITLGGPIKIPHAFTDQGRNKLFFFVGADWKANHYASTLNSRNTFTAPIRQGNLSSEPEAPGGAVLKPYASLDAAHQAILAARNPSNPSGCIFQESGSGNYNAILPACMDPNAVALMNALWPLPNYSSASANYINTNPVKFSVNDQIYRGDWNVGDRNTITVRLMHEEATQINASRNYNDPSPTPDSLTYDPALDGLVRWQFTISPNLINSFAIGEVYSKYNSLVTGYQLPSGVNIAQKFPGADPLNRIPDISMNNDTHSAENWFWLGVGALPTHSNNQTGSASDDVSWVHRNHVFQGGFDFLTTMLSANAASAFPMGNFCINGFYSGDTAADFLLGFLSQGASGCSFGYEQTNTQRAGRFHNNWTEAYFQDDWTATPRLTINLGLRWSYFTAPTKDGDDISNFVPSTFNASQAPAISTTGAFTLNAQNQPLTTSGAVANLSNNGMVTACQSVPCGFTVPRKGSFAPRIGFAYRLTSDGKTSVHGGFGMGYTQVGLLQTSNLLSNIPFVQQPTYNSTEFSSPSGAAGAIANPPGLTALSATAPNYQPASLRNYSLTFEREVFNGAVFQIGYAGMVTQHVFTTGFDWNYPLNGTSANSATCASSSGLSGQPTTGFQYDPCINTGGVSSVYYRPYAGYSTINTGISLGVANYNGLLVGYVQKMKQVTAHVSYTYSRALSDVNATGIQAPYSSSGAFQNPHNPIGDYGLPNFDRTHVFVYSVVYEPSIFNRLSSPTTRSLLGGWTLSSFMTAESGFALTPTYSNGLATRPNLVQITRNPGSGKASIGQMPVYSSTDFTKPYYGFYGTATIGSLRGPKEVAVHAALEKGFNLPEGFSMRFGAQGFNIFNHPNVLNLNTSWAAGSSSFGTATAYGDPRQMQFFAKLNF